MGMPGTGEERGEQVPLIACAIGQETSRVVGAAALARDDEREVLCSCSLPSSLARGSTSRRQATSR